MSGRDSVRVERGQIVIRMGIAGAEWLVQELPHGDGFTRDLWRAIEYLLAERAEMEV